MYNNYTMIFDWLYIGGFCAEIPDELNITAILSIGEKFHGKINYSKIIMDKYINMIDDSTVQNLQDIYTNSNIFLKECYSKKLNVYLHCAYGQSRSPSILIYYLIKNENMTLQESMNLINEKREICINPAFIKYLDSINKNSVSNLNPTIVDIY